MATEVWKKKYRSEIKGTGKTGNGKWAGNEKSKWEMGLCVKVAWTETSGDSWYLGRLETNSGFVHKQSQKDVERM